LSRRPRRGPSKQKQRANGKGAARAAARGPQRAKSRQTPSRSKRADSVAATAKTARDDIRAPKRRRLPKDTPDGPTEAAALRPTQPRAVITPATLPLSIQWEILACVVLCAAGATLGVITVLGEMRYHILSPTRCAAYALAALCAGIVLGLCVPRGIIRRRLTRRTGDANKMPLPQSVQPGDLKLEFAASLAGGLILAFALTWVMLSGGAVLMEGYRGVLVRRFAPPVWLTHLLLSGPILAGLALAGATGTTLLVAMHGWYRLVTQPKTEITRLWAGMLVGVLAAGLLAGQVASRPILTGLALLALFAAGAIAVLRRSDAVATPAIPDTRTTLLWGEWLALPTAGLAAALAATALVLASPPAGATAHNPPVHIVALAGATCAGLAGTRLIGRLRLSLDLGSPALLLGAVALLMSYQYIVAPVNVALVRLVVVSGCAAACVALVSQRIAITHHSIQSAFSLVGRFVAGGFGAALVLLPTSVERWNPSASATVVAIIATAGAGATLVLDRRMKTIHRLAGLICIAVWLTAVPSARRALAEALQAREAQPQHAAPGPFVQAARQLVTADPFHTACLRPFSPGPGATEAFRFDLTGPALDLVILESPAGSDDPPVPDADGGRRLLRRIGTRLARGGRLLVELPIPPHFADALDQFTQASGGRDWSGYRLRVRDETREYQALVFGRDIPALIERNQRGSELEVSLEAIRSPRPAEN